MTLPTSVRRKDGGKIPGAQNVPNVIEIKNIVQQPNGKQVSWTIHGFYTTAPPSLQALSNALFTGISGLWGTDLSPLMPPGTVYQAVHVRDMTSFLNPVVVSTGTVVPGTSASPPMPADNAIVMTEQVASRGKGLKGRVYLPGWATNADGGQGQITVAAQSAINTFGTSLLNLLTTNNLAACVAQVARQSYIGLTGSTHPARTAGHVNVTAYLCQDLEWDTQRRRGN